MSVSCGSKGPSWNPSRDGNRGGSISPSHATLHGLRPPEFRSGIPTQLTSWKKKGLLWGSSEEVTGLQACIQKLVKKLWLVNVVQVMLVRRILPCQERAFNLREFNPEQHQALSGLFDTTYEGAWRVLFKGAEAPASATEDRGFRSQRQADEVSDSTPLRDTCFS